MAICWYCEKEIEEFAYKIARHPCALECADREIERSKGILTRLLAEVDSFVGFGLGFENPEFFWYIFVENEETGLALKDEFSSAQMGFSIYPLVTNIPRISTPDPIKAIPENVVLGGVSIGHLNSKTAGTIGGILTMGDRKYVVSTSQILAPDGANLGDLIVQPSVIDSPQRGYALAKLSVISRLAPGSVNDLDAALGTLNTVVPSTPRIKYLGRPSGVVDPRIGMNVRKTGRTSGFTEGRVLCIDAKVKLIRDNHLLFIQDQFIAMSEDSIFAESGDEGSFLLDNNNALVGMIQIVFHGMAICARGTVLLERFGFQEPDCFEPGEEGL